MGSNSISTIRCRLLSLASLLLASVGGSFASSHAKTISVSTDEYLLQQSALIAHVRVAGVVEFGQRPVQVVEILDSARGPAVGQLVLVACDKDEREGVWTRKDIGEEAILFAERNDQRLFQPVRMRESVLAVGEDGLIADKSRLQNLVPPAVGATAKGVIAHLRDACERTRLEISVRLNEDDIAHYERDRPLRVEIEIKNVGEEEVGFQNHIEYKYIDSAFVDRERLCKEQRAIIVPRVKVLVQRAGHVREMCALVSRMERLSVTELLSPGARAIGTFDLGEEHDIRCGGSFWVWAEVGGQSSPRVLLELPRGVDEAMELMEELDMLAEDGPFRVHQATQATPRMMPPVEPVVEAAAAEAALAYWFTNARLGRPHHQQDENQDEVIILRSSHITPATTPKVEGMRFLSTDAAWAEDGAPTELTTTSGPATFRWRTVRIKSVQVHGAKATVEVVQNDRHNLGGSGATMQLRRRGAAWNVRGEVLMWQG